MAPSIATALQLWGAGVFLAASGQGGLGKEKQHGCQSRPPMFVHRRGSTKNKFVRSNFPLLRNLPTKAG